MGPLYRVNAPNNVDIRRKPSNDHVVLFVVDQHEGRRFVQSPSREGLRSILTVNGERHASRRCPHARHAGRKPPNGQSPELANVFKATIYQIADCGVLQVS